MGLQIDIQNLINQKSQELKLIEMMGGSLTALFQENLFILAEIDGDIRKKTNEIEVLKQKGHKRHKQNPWYKAFFIQLKVLIVVHFHPFSHRCGPSQQQEALIKKRLEGMQLPLLRNPPPWG
jgi:hypothetical protein